MSKYDDPPSQQEEDDMIVDPPSQQGGGQQPQPQGMSDDDVSHPLDGGRFLRVHPKAFCRAAK